MSLLSRLSTEPGGFLPAPWLEQAVFGLDRWLRRRQGVYEYTSNPSCLFRIQRARAELQLSLTDSTRIVPGDPILNLHLWNEQLPHMGPEGATVAWACQVSRGIDASLRELARYIKRQPDLNDVVALRADMRLSTGEQNHQLVRLSGRYGFEPVGSQSGTILALQEGALHRFGENILIFLLVLASNPVALRTALFRRDHKLIYLSRAALERRYVDAIDRHKQARSLQHVDS